MTKSRCLTGWVCLIGYKHKKHYVVPSWLSFEGKHGCLASLQKGVNSSRCFTNFLSQLNCDHGLHAEEPSPKCNALMMDIVQTLGRLWPLKDLKCGEQHSLIIKKCYIFGWLFFPHFKSYLTHLLLFPPTVLKFYGCRGLFWWSLLWIWTLQWCICVSSFCISYRLTALAFFLVTSPTDFKGTAHRNKPE